MAGAVILLTAALAGQPQVTPQQLPSDPLQRCAARALYGDFGKLNPWQTSGYKAAVEDGVTVQGLAWVTGYYPWEHDGHNTRSGRKPSLRSAAVQRRDYHACLFRYVWTSAYGLRIVEDSGANSNTRVARRYGADRWLDYYWRTRHDRNPVTEYAIFGRSK